MITSIALSVQAKSIRGKLSTVYATADSEVKKAQIGLTPFKGTYLQLEFLQNCSSSWQAHLEKKGIFLVHGEGVWWKKQMKECYFLIVKMTLNSKNQDHFFLILG